MSSKCYTDFQWSPRGYQKYQQSVHQLNSNRNPPPRYYSEDKGLAQILLSRLRTNCSSLNQHLYSKNIVQSVLCARGSIKDKGHFLLHCPLYHNYRQDMLRSMSRLCQPSLNTLLYGNDKLSFGDNKHICISVQEFIVKTKIFQVNHSRNLYASPFTLQNILALV